MNAEAITLGCRLNFAESEALKARAPDGTIIVNSCAVTGEAVRQTRQAIRRAKRDRPDARIVVTGCAAQLEPERFAAMPEVDLVLGNGAKHSRHPGLDPGSAFLSFGQKTRRTPAQGRGDDWKARIVLPDLSTTTPIVAAGFRQRVRSFVAVQTGCDHRCTFCTIWAARGPSRSLPFAAIRDAIARELDGGAAEIVLTGVDITSYACPEQSRGEGGLGPLCEKLLAALPNLKRLRLSSLDSVEMDEALLGLLPEPRLMPHFHLSLQAGDDLILKRMKRRHSRAQAVDLVERIKAARPDATIGADLIAGFPTESEEAARNSLSLLEDCDIIAAHVFPFSPRPNTPAARMPQLERELVKARAARLREAAARRRSAWLDGLVGTPQPVLIENNAKGHTDSFAPVAIAGSKRGDTGLARIVARTGDHLLGVFA
jgi:threonylcarbamoyladenosine tRNA methylthiotransferase MtaB